MTDKNIFSAARIFAGARLSVLCICLFLLMVLVQSGIYTPQGKGGDFLSRDWPVIILLLWIGFISFRYLPVWRLKRKGLNKRQIRRAKRLSDRALQSPKGVLFHFVYFFMMLFAICFLIVSSILFTIFYPNGALAKIFQNEFYCAFILTALPQLLCQAVLANRVLSVWQKKKAV